MKRPFAVIGFTYISVQTVAVLFGFSVAVTIACLGAAAALVYFITMKKPNKIFMAVLITASVGGIFFSIYHALCVAPMEKLWGKEAFISGVVSRSPEEKNGAYYYYIKTDTILLDGAPQKATVRLYCKTSLELEYNDCVSASVKFGTPDTSHLYSARTRLLSSGIDATASVSSEDATSVRKNGAGVLTPAIALRDNICSVIDTLYPDDSGALLKTMITGNDGFLSHKELTQLRRAGLSHMTAVSGVHISLIIGGIIWLLRKLHLHRKAVSVAAMLVIWLYIAMVGFPLSALRSGIMASVMLLGTLIDRQHDQLNSLGFAVLCICLVNPYHAADVGLMLSFSSTLGIILTAPYVPKITGHFLNDKQGGLVLIARPLLNGSIVSSTVFFFTLPVTAIVYKQIPLLSIPVNVLLSPLITIYLFAGILSAVIGMLGNVGMFAAYPFMVASRLIEKLITAVVGAVSSIPGAVLNMDNTSVYVILSVLVMLALYYVLFFRKKSDRKTGACITFLLCCFLLFSGYVCHRVLTPSDSIIIYDAGSGVSVMSCHGKSGVLIGAGGTEYDVRSTHYKVGVTGCDDISALIIPEFSDKFSSRVYLAEELFEPENVLICDDSYEQYMPENAVICSDTATVKADGMKITVSPDPDGILWTRVECGKISALVCPTKGDCLNSPFAESKFDMIICPGYLPANVTALHCDTIVLCASQNSSTDNARAKARGFKNVFGTDTDGDLMFYMKNGNMHMEVLDN